MIIIAIIIIHTELERESILMAKRYFGHWPQRVGLIHGLTDGRTDGRIDTPTGEGQFFNRQTSNLLCDLCLATVVSTNVSASVTTSDEATIEI